MKQEPSWRVFQGTGQATVFEQHPLDKLPDAPPWRRFQDANRYQRRGSTFRATEKTIDIVNAAIYLRRPLLVTGKPGTGKSSLAYAIAYELALGSVLGWPINTRSTLQEGLYSYDAIGRLQDAQLRKLTDQHKDKPGDIGRYLHLGALGTSLLPTERPRVLLIDEIDKADIDLPNDLLNILEEGEFAIQELLREQQVSGPTATNIQTADNQTISLESALVKCTAFPIVIMTSNGERDFPPAFLRRCLRLDMPLPTLAELTEIVELHLGPDLTTEANKLIQTFFTAREQAQGDLATDQLLNIVYLLTQSTSTNLTPESEGYLRETVLQRLSSE